MSLYDDLPPPTTTNSTISSSISSTSSSVSSDSKQQGRSPSSKAKSTEEHSIQSESWSVEAKLLAPALRRIAAQKQQKPQKKTPSNPPSKRSKKKKKKVINSNLLQSNPQVAQILLAPTNDEEEYDPIKPNDYEELVEERIQKQSSKERYYESEESEGENMETKSLQQTHSNPNQGLPQGTSIVEDHKPSESSVILLTNMVGPGEVDEELKGEIEDECTKYGRVERCEIFEDNRIGVPPEESVRIFVKFKSIGAKQAMDALNGRFFGGRTVHVSLFDEDKYYRKEFEYPGKV